MRRLTELFEIEYGNKFDLNKMRRLGVADSGINFIGRSGENNGVTAKVARLLDVLPYEGGLITVALGGSILSAFVQDQPFYTAQNVAVLKPRSGVSLSFSEKVFICLCIRHNRFRYSTFGREVNRTIKEIRIPDLDEFPVWVKTEQGALGNVSAPITKTARPLQMDSWRSFRLGDLFAIRKGRRVIGRDRKPGSIPFVGASKKRNGIVSYISAEPMFSAGTISIPYNGEGAVGYAFYQPIAFCASDDVQVLEPLPENSDGIDQAALMFVCVILRRERYRYSFGRKWHLARMLETTIRLPTTTEGGADWSALSSFIKGLPFSRVALSAW